MKMKNLKVLIPIILIITFSISAGANLEDIEFEKEYKIKKSSSFKPLELTRNSWGLQWTKHYGAQGHEQHAKPIGDIDEDGFNEIIIGGYASQGARILSYDLYTATYEEEYFWNYPGGTYNGIPTGSCVIDLENDGDLEFVVSFEHGGKNGIIAYDWNGNILNELDYYFGLGYDFAYDVYACDYDDDGVEEVIIANAPEYGTGANHVTALEWVNGEFIHSASWRCKDTGEECPMVWSGDPDNDGDTEIVAAGSESLAAYVLFYDGMKFIEEAKIHLGTNIYSVTLGDLDNDGIDEIGIGGYNSNVHLYQFQDGEYNQVWSRIYSTEEGIMEAITIGDADNDGINEFLIGTDIVHIIQWDEYLDEYVEEATLVESHGKLSGVVIGDCDSDGVNEVKATETFGAGGTGAELIYKYFDNTPPVTTCILHGEMENGFYITSVGVEFQAVDDYSYIQETWFKSNEFDWMKYNTPFEIEEDGTYTLYFYSVDGYGNVETEKSVTFTIKHSCCYSVEIPRGISIGLKASVIEEDNEAHTNISWKFEISGSDIFAITPLSGNFDISARETVTVRSLLVFGFGVIYIKVKIDECPPIDSSALIIGPLVLVL